MSLGEEKVRGGKWIEDNDGRRLTRQKYNLEGDGDGGWRKCSIFLTEKEKRGNRPQY